MKTRICALLLIAGITAVTLSPAPPVAAQRGPVAKKDMGKGFVEDFSTLNPKRWQVFLRPHADLGILSNCLKLGEGAMILTTECYPGADIGFEWSHQVYNGARVADQLRVLLRCTGEIDARGMEILNGIQVRIDPNEGKMYIECIKAGAKRVLKEVQFRKVNNGFAVQPDINQKHRVDIVDNGAEIQVRAHGVTLVAPFNVKDFQGCHVGFADDASGKRAIFLRNVAINPAMR